MFRRAILALLLALPLLGCSSDRERNSNRDRDRPKSGEKEEKKSSCLPVRGFSPTPTRIV